MDPKAREVTQSAVNEIIRLSNTFRGILALGEQLQAGLSLEQQAQEASNRIDDLHKEHAAVMRQHAAAAEEAQRKVDLANARREDLLEVHSRLKDDIAAAENRLAELRSQVKSTTAEHAAARERHATFIKSLSEA